jgi:uncharacterized protein YijF (DUF1287 family)
VTTSYDPAYQRIPFPNGDLPRSTGVCTDVVIRALRDARRLDLQREVNADMKANWDAYPRRWQWLHRKPDPNIDHRRVPNLMTFFQRRGYALPLSNDPAKFRAGDIVAWDLGRGILHIGVVSDARPFSGVPDGHPQHRPRHGRRRHPAPASRSSATIVYLVLDLIGRLAPWNIRPPS